jgi:hypothetical protein
MFSKLYTVNNRVGVDVSLPGYPRGISFSLDDMLPDNSSSTISLSMARDLPEPDGYVLLTYYCILDFT